MRVEESLSIKEITKRLEELKNVGGLSLQGYYSSFKGNYKEGVGYLNFNRLLTMEKTRGYNGDVTL